MRKLVLFSWCLLSISAYSQKKVLDHTVYDSWQSIKETVLQPQGEFVAYVVAPQEGDANLVVKHLKGNWSLQIPRGAQPIFTGNGHFLIAKIKPLFTEMRKGKIDKKKADELPKDSLLILNLLDKSTQVIPSVKSFQIPEKGNDIIAYLVDKKGDINKDGSELVIKNLTNAFKVSYKNIAQFAMQPNGDRVLLYQVNSKLSPAQIILANTKDTLNTQLSSRFFSATGFSWDEQGQQVAYLIEPDSTSKALQKKYQLAYFTQGMDSAYRVLTSTHEKLPINYVFGGDRKLKFSKSGAVLELGIQPLLPAKDTSLPEFDRVSLDIWHYDDANLQPMQLKNLETSLKSTETLLYRPKDKSVTYLGKIKERDIISTNEGDGLFTYATIDSNYSHAVQWQGYALKDVYAIHTISNKSTLIQKAFKGNLLSPSPNGNQLVYYSEPQKKYFAYNAVTGQTTQLASDIKGPLFDEENDVPDDPNAYGIAKWLDNNEQFILYDRYDLWLVDASGKRPSVQLTNGRARKIVYRFVETDVERTALKPDALVILRGYNELDKSELIASLLLSTKKTNTINAFPMHLTTIIGAKHSDTFIVYQEDEQSAPNLYAYALNTQAQKPLELSAINPQQNDYNWLTSEIVKWNSYTGKMTEGVLYKPSNFDASKKYPMIVYFYERNNQTLHNYLPPQPTGSRLNIPFFVSRGYVVFVPDIWYRKGYPGQSAYDYIVSGTKAMIQKGFIDSTKIGLQGQSWGGYQIAYLVTKSNLYAAAWAGAPVVNMTSAYGGIRWGSGMSRQFQYEKTQSRLGASLWERPDLYIKNSPLFSLPKVTTPLVIMSNDADDAVPWYQGIEMFTAMKRLHKKVWLLVYNNEAHNLIERRNKKDIQIREQQFFDHYLKNEPMPVWMKEGVPAIMKGRDLGLGFN